MTHTSHTRTRDIRSKNQIKKDAQIVGPLILARLRFARVNAVTRDHGTAVPFVANGAFDLVVSTMSKHTHYSGKLHRVSQRLKKNPKTT